MSLTDPKVDGFLRKAKRWRDEMQKLREIVLDSPLTEGVKWRAPCYTLEGKNVVLINAFKEFAALLFFKGALLKDAKGILVRPGNTQAGRFMKFTSVGQIVAMERVVKAYIHEAIAVEKSGVKVPLKKHTEYVIPEELQKKLDELPALKAAFTGLTPGRQRAYMFHISSAKQSKTRESRVDNCIPQILKGKGLDD